jgi:hypothetical protein
MVNGSEAGDRICPSLRDQGSRPSNKAGTIPQHNRTRRRDLGLLAEGKFECRNRHQRRQNPPTCSASGTGRRKSLCGRRGLVRVKIGNSKGTQKINFRLFKISLQLATVFLLPRLALSGHLPGDTITNSKGTTLQPNVCNQILASERRAAPVCRQVHIVQTAIIGEPRRLGLRINQWSERWMIDRCGTRIFYLIHFDFRGSVGTFKIEGPNRVETIK